MTTNIAPAFSTFSLRSHKVRATGRDAFQPYRRKGHDN
jgi:hypothetical protein